MSDKKYGDKAREILQYAERAKLAPEDTYDLIQEQLGAPEEVSIETTMQCACGHLKSINNFPIRNTGVVDAIYNVCKDCHKDSLSAAHLVCISCKTTRSHYEPGKEPLGFEMRKDGFYHITNCAYCTTADKGCSPILEQILFYKKNNIPYKTDPEFEQKENIENDKQQ